ncbi:hypothetical protein So717_04480 [Roseobacter cerasinus]|uniref:Uncharacterized protein n=1 Tax=Roseobacter cerasinus TaxID=2602289 RepID=A0A640VP86_9RHOB|nr:hypothetical protein So717_04480 [Roseobacter cerasinus]
MQLGLLPEALRLTKAAPLLNRTLAMACGSWFEAIPFGANGCDEGFPLWLGDRD